MIPASESIRHRRNLIRVRITRNPDSDHAELAATEQAQREVRCGRGLNGRSRYCRVGRLPVWDVSSLSATFAVRPGASSHRQAFLFSLSKNATGFNQDDTAGLDAFDFHLVEKPRRTLLEAAACNRRMQPRDAAIRAACRSPRLEAAHWRAASAQAVEHVVLTPAVPASQWRLAVPKGHSCQRIPLLSLLRVKRADSAAAAVLPHAKTAPVYLWCPTRRASARMSSGPSPQSPMQ